MKLRRSLAVVSLAALAACSPAGRAAQDTVDSATYFVPVAPVQTSYGAYPAAPAAAVAPAGMYGEAVAAPPATAAAAVPAGQYPPAESYRVRPRYADESYHLVGAYNDGESHPLRIASFALAPVGFLAEWLVARPIHRIVAQQDLAPVFSYTPIAGYDYETYEEGLSSGVTFEDPHLAD